MNLPDLQDARDHLNVTPGQQDAELATKLESAVAVVEGLVGPLAPRPVTELVEHPGGPLLVLPTAPVLSVTSVARYLGDGTLGTTYAGSRFIVDGAAGLVTYIGSPHLAQGWLQVTYVAGRPAGALPADLHGAVLEQVRHLWETQRGGVPQRGGDQGMGPRAFTVPNRVAQLVEPYLLGDVSIA